MLNLADRSDAQDWKQQYHNTTITYNTTTKSNKNIIYLFIYFRTRQNIKNDNAIHDKKRKIQCNEI